MLSSLLTYVLALYLPFHVLNRADWAAPLRRWVGKVGTLSQLTSCALCWTFWWSIILTVLGLVELSLVGVLAAPVLALGVDLAIAALLRAAEPPVIPVYNGVPPTGCEASSATVACFPSVWTPQTPPPSPTYTWTSCMVYPPIGGPGHKDVTPSHVGSRARLSRVSPYNSIYGKEGLITRHFVDGDDCSGTFRQTCYAIKDLTHAVPVANCDLLPEEPPAAAGGVTV